MADRAITAADLPYLDLEQLRPIALCSPERHGAMTGIIKAQIDWILPSLGGVRPTQGKALAVMQ